MKTEILIDAIQDVAQSIGFHLLKIREENYEVGDWHGDQFKSKADLIAEQKWFEKLRLLTPNTPVLSEESLESHEIDRTATYWLIDPIDGTASFCGGYDGFVTQIALIYKGEPTLGLVHAPALSKIYLAEHGSGATLNNKKLKLEQTIKDITIVDNYPKASGVSKKIMEALPCSEYLESGSIGLKICLVADGSAELFVKDVTMRDWDLGPGDLILRESGGHLQNFYKKRIDYSGDIQKNNGLIAAVSVNLANRVADLISGGTLDG